MAKPSPLAENDPPKHIYVESYTHPAYIITSRQDICIEAYYTLALVRNPLTTDWNIFDRNSEEQSDSEMEDRSHEG